MSKHTVTLVFSDGRSETIKAEETDTIYMACLRNKIRILTDCLEGACATCKGVCVEGEYEIDDYSDEALSEEEAARREVLTCQMHVKSDCIIELPYESRLALKSDPRTWPCRVSAVKLISSTVARLELTPVESDDPAPEFLAGQYVHLSVPGTTKTRSYSFANPPHETGSLVFYIKILDQGVMSEYLRDRAKAGDEITMTGPFGRFYLRKPERPIVMVAGGTGLAPMLSMLDHMVEAGWTGQPVHLLCGANQPDELFCRDDISSYGQKGVSVTVEYAVVEGASDWNGTVGHVTGLLRPDLIGGATDFYLCGPPPMISAAEGWLAEQRVDAKNIHSEKFIPS
jgi:NAD(P)H-flavin reductase/ferredoxin